MRPADSKSLLLFDWRRMRARRRFASPGCQPAERRQQVLRRLRPLCRARLAILVLTTDCWILMSQMPSCSKTKVLGYSLLSPLQAPTFLPSNRSKLLSISCRKVRGERAHLPSHWFESVQSLRREAYSPRPLCRLTGRTARDKALFGTTAVLTGWHHGACVQRVNGDWSMLPWLMTFHAARLGLEAQNAMAFRFFRLVGDSFGLMADSKKIDSVDRIASPLEDPPAPIKAASNGGRRRASVSKVHKKQVRANKRTKRFK